MCLDTNTNAFSPKLTEVILCVQRMKRHLLNLTLFLTVGFIADPLWRNLNKNLRDNPFLFIPLQILTRQKIKAKYYLQPNHFNL